MLPKTALFQSLTATVKAEVEEVMEWPLERMDLLEDLVELIMV